MPKRFRAPLIGALCATVLSTICYAEPIQTQYYVVVADGNDSQKGLTLLDAQKLAITRTIIDNPNEGLPTPEFAWYLVQDRVDGAYSIKAKTLGDAYCLDVYVETGNPHRNLRWEPEFNNCLTHDSYYDKPFPDGGVGYATCGDYPNGQSWNIENTGESVPGSFPSD